MSDNTADNASDNAAQSLAHTCLARTWVDLRPAELRFAQPLERLLQGERIKAISLSDIEREQHGLSAEDGPLVVICERGVRSPLAAQLLQADGLEAKAYAGGMPALRRVLERGEQP